MLSNQDLQVDGQSVHDAHSVQSAHASPATVPQPQRLDIRAQTESDATLSSSSSYNAQSCAESLQTSPATSSSDTSSSTWTQDSSVGVRSNNGAAVGLNGRTSHSKAPVTPTQPVRRRLGLVFGREQGGLTEEELDAVHATCSIPIGRLQVRRSACTVQCYADELSHVPSHVHGVKHRAAYFPRLD